MPPKKFEKPPGLSDIRGKYTKKTSQDSYSYVFPRVSILPGKLKPAVESSSRGLIPSATANGALSFGGNHVDQNPSHSASTPNRLHMTISSPQLTSAALGDLDLENRIRQSGEGSGGILHRLVNPEGVTTIALAPDGRLILPEMNSTRLTARGFMSSEDIEFSSVNRNQLNTSNVRGRFGSGILPSTEISEALGLSDETTRYTSNRVQFGDMSQQQLSSDSDHTQSNGISEAELEFLMNEISSSMALDAVPTRLAAAPVDPEDPFGMHQRLPAQFRSFERYLENKFGLDDGAERGDHPSTLELMGEVAAEMLQRRDYPLPQPPAGNPFRTISPETHRSNGLLGPPSTVAQSSSTTETSARLFSSGSPTPTSVSPTYASLVNSAAPLMTPQPTTIATLAGQQGSVFQPLLGSFDTGQNYFSLSAALMSHPGVRIAVDPPPPLSTVTSESEPPSEREEGFDETEQETGERLELVGSRHNWQNEPMYQNLVPLRHLDQWSFTFPNVAFTEVERLVPPDREAFYSSISWYLESDYQLSAPLPTGWSQGRSPLGRRYYAHEESESTTWHHPWLEGKLSFGWERVDSLREGVYYHMLFLRHSQRHHPNLWFTMHLKPKGLEEEPCFTALRRLQNMPDQGKECHANVKAYYASKPGFEEQRFLLFFMKLSLEDLQRANQEIDELCWQELQDIVIAYEHYRDALVRELFSRCPPAVLFDTSSGGPS